MSKIATYIFVHDQQVVLDADQDRRYDNLPNVRYVFLGMKAVDKIKYRRDVIVSRNLEHNIEKYPRLCSFTGWYALWKNNIITSEYVCLMEYDIAVREDFSRTIGDLIKQKYEFIGYVPLSMRNTYVDSPGHLANIELSIKKHYGIDVIDMVGRIISKDSKAMWSSSSNCTFSLETFNEYMRWFEIIMRDIKNDKMCGHAHERSISFFYLISGKKIFLTNGLITHMMMCSHRS